MGLRCFFSDSTAHTGLSRCPADNDIQSMTQIEWLGIFNNYNRQTETSNRLFYCWDKSLNQVSWYFLTH